MKEVPDWTEEDLARLISDVVKESLTLDYKAADALSPKTDRVKNEVSKDVSAFANSAGGTIIYGMKEDRTIPVELDGIDSSGVTREWLDQVISSRIQRRIDGIRIQQVDLSDGRVAYIVQIPQSDSAPHMAADNKYYKRFEFRSVPMEDYEVRDVSSRLRSPRIDVVLSVAPGLKLSFSDDSAERSQPVLLLGNITNDSPAPANHAVCHLILDGRLEAKPAGFGNRQAVGDVGLDMWQLNWGVPGKMPLWQGMSFNLFSEKCEITFPRGKGQYPVAWTVRAPGMTQRGGAYLIGVEAEGVVNMFGQPGSAPDTQAV